MNRFKVVVTIDGMADYLAATDVPLSEAAQVANLWATIGGWIDTGLRIPAHRVVSVELIESQP